MIHISATLKGNPATEIFVTIELAVSTQKRCWPLGLRRPGVVALRPGRSSFFRPAGAGRFASGPPGSEGGGPRQPFLFILKDSKRL